MILERYERDVCVTVIKCDTGVRELFFLYE